MPLYFFKIIFWKECKNIARKFPITLYLNYYVLKDSLELKNYCLLGLKTVGFFERTLLKLHGWTNNLNKEMSKLFQELPWLAESLNGS